MPDFRGLSAGRFGGQSEAIKPHNERSNTMTTLTRANAEWSRRPADERYNSLESLHAAAVHLFELTKESRPVVTRDLRTVVGDNGEVLLQGSTGAQARMTNWSFGQVARAAGAPASYLETLPAEMVPPLLNHGLAKVEESSRSKLLFKQNGDFVLRALTSPSYARIHHADITSRLLRLQAESGWQPAPAAFDGSRGLYLGDRDMFAFMVDSERRIFETAPGGGLSRGFFVSQSDVGSAAFNVSTFSYEYICGNHRVWGAKMLGEINIRHVGSAADKAFSQMSVELKKYAESSAAEEEAHIASCRAYELGDSKDAVLDRIFGLRIPILSRKVAALAYDKAESRVDWYGSPRSAWGFAGGLTEIARDLPNADDRHALDKAAGKVMAIAF